MYPYSLFSGSTNEPPSEPQNPAPPHFPPGLSMEKINFVKPFRNNSPTGGKFPWFPITPKRLYSFLYVVNKLISTQPSSAPSYSIFSFELSSYFFISFTMWTSILSLWCRHPILKYIILYFLPLYLTSSPSPNHFHPISFCTHTIPFPYQFLPWCELMDYDSRVTFSVTVHLH